MKYWLDKPETEPIGRRIASDIGLGVKYDTSVILQQNFIDAIRDGSKKHTMKFHQENGKDVIRLPKYRILPLMNKTLDDRLVGELAFNYVELLRWKEVGAKHAVEDGFKGQWSFMRETEKLAKDRGFELVPESYVSFYRIEDVRWI